MGPRQGRGPPVFKGAFLGDAGHAVPEGHLKGIPRIQSRTTHRSLNSLDFRGKCFRRQPTTRERELHA